MCFDAGGKRPGLGGGKRASVAIVMTATAGQPLPAAVATDPDDTFRFERALYRGGCARVAGIDEAGRGPLAGPVVAACVILPPDGDHSVFKDSKLLTARRRAAVRPARRGGCLHRRG